MFRAIPLRGRRVVSGSGRLVGPWMPIGGGSVPEDARSGAGDTGGAGRASPMVTPFRMMGLAPRRRLPESAPSVIPTRV